MTGARRADAGASTGTYLVLAALNRVVAPCSELGFADWWARTAAPRFTKIPASVCNHRRFWDAMHAVTVEELAEISRRIALAIVAQSGLDCSSVALDMTNFATFIDTANQKAPIAQRGKAKQKRSDLRLVGLGLVVTRDGGIPLTWHAYPGDRPDVTQFPAMIKALRGQYEAITAACGQQPADMTVVFDAGQNSAAARRERFGAGSGRPAARSLAPPSSRLCSNQFWRTILVSGANQILGEPKGEPTQADARRHRPMPSDDHRS